MNAYNDIVQFIKDQDTAALAGKASLARNPLLRGFRNSFREALHDEYGTGTFTRLAQIGVGFDRNRQAHARQDRAECCGRLVGHRCSNAGFGQPMAPAECSARLPPTVEEYTKAGGLVGLARERLTTQVKGLDTRLDALEARLSVRRLALQKEYLEADRLMSQLQSQGNSLQQLGFEFKSLGS